MVPPQIREFLRHPPQEERSSSMLWIDKITAARSRCGVFLFLLRTAPVAVGALRRVASPEQRFRPACPRFAPCEFGPLGKALSQQFSPDTWNPVRRVLSSVRQ